MNDKANQSLSVTPPVSGQNTIVLASGTSSRRIQIPSDWKGWITIQSEGVSAHVTFGGSGVTADPTATSTVVSEEVTAHGTGECQFIAQDDSLPVNLDEIRLGPTDIVFMADIESATGGYLRLVRASGTVALS